MRDKQQWKRKTIPIIVANNNEKKNYIKNKNNNEKRDYIKWNCTTLLSLSLFCHIVGVITKQINGTLISICLFMWIIWLFAITKHIRLLAIGMTGNEM
jgi:uncharacterized membrane protein